MTTDFSDVLPLPSRPCLSLSRVNSVRVTSTLATTSGKVDLRGFASEDTGDTSLSSNIVMSIMVAIVSAPDVSCSASRPHPPRCDRPLRLPPRRLFILPSYNSTMHSLLPSASEICFERILRQHPISPRLSRSGWKCRRIRRDKAYRSFRGDAVRERR